MITSFKFFACFSAGILVMILLNYIFGRLVLPLSYCLKQLKLTPNTLPTKPYNLVNLLRSTRREWSPVKLHRYRFIISITVSLFPLLWTGKFVIALIVGSMVFTGIGWYITNIKNREKVLFEDQLLDALGIIINSVRSGQSLSQAIEQVAANTKHPISTQFNEVQRQVKLGMPLNEALLIMVDRTKSKDLNIVASAINLAKETGGSLGEILTRIAATVRERKKVQGKINALTAQGKASATVISCVPFLLLMVLYTMEPAMVGLLFNTLIGNIMLLAVTGMIFMGIFFIKRIITIDI